MSLVAYESSDGSDNDSDNDTSEPKSPMKTSLPGPISTPKPDSNDISTTKETANLSENTLVKKGLFSKLPAPKCTTDLLPEDPISRNIPKKETVKIRIPSLKEFEEDEEEEKNRMKRKPSKVGSGLMSLLPEPQHLALKMVAKQLIPPSVTRKAASVQPSGTSKPKPCLRKLSDSTNDPLLPNSVSPAAKVQEDNASDEETLTDFFSLSGTKEPELDQPENEKLTSVLIEEPSIQRKNKVTSVYMGPLKEGSESNSAYFSNAAYSSVSCNSNSSLEHVNSYNSHNVYESTNSQSYDWSNPSANSDVSAIKNEDFVRLAGKKRNAQESIEIVDVNGDDLVAGRDEWLLKSLSETNDYQPQPKRSDQPSAMHRRKHQITYLAFQAKAREQELKNQWSMNRMTKKQTQSKYGF